jgi:flagellar protein FlgJ
MDPIPGLVSDSRSLDRLKSAAARDPKAAVRQAAGQFEALFMQMVLKSMRDAMPKSGLTDGPSHEMFTSMLDQQLAQSLAGRPGGLGEVIARQLSSRMAASPATEPVRTSSAPADFVRDMWPHAQQAERQTGVPASFAIGQAALESGWGHGEIRRADGAPSFNLFGIKAGPGWKGATVDVTTTEYAAGQPRKQVERFRAYGSYAEAFRDWAGLMQGNARYGQVLRTSSSVEGYARGMQQAGYATDPAYGAKLERTINQTIAIRRTLT